jgi:hypothetical protein
MQKVSDYRTLNVVVELDCDSSRLMLRQDGRDVNGVWTDVSNFAGTIRYACVRSGDETDIDADLWIGDLEVELRLGVSYDILTKDRNAGEAYAEICCPP